MLPAKQIPATTAPAVHKSLDVMEKLQLLSTAARYDAACASSGSTRQNSGEGFGAAHNSGICHSWSADGRCISLLKVLYSNNCRYDCAYCVNRRSNDHRRTSFTPQELAQLTSEFYRRNYIEGLFLSSAVFSNPDDSMQPLLQTLRLLRQNYRFHGYIHLKIIPGCSPELLAEAARLADRMSANIELPSEQSLRQLAPEKDEREILQVFHHVHQLTGDHRLPARRQKKDGINPAGMSTQMIVGATPETDFTILQRADLLYRGPGLKRVYYSAYIPVNADNRLPTVSTTPPLLREHRLYQADWLLRFYDFRLDEIIDPAHPQLETDLDPKAAWALRHLQHFPLDINRASKEELLRVPGIGVRSTLRILKARRHTRLQANDLKKLGIVMKRARYFLHDGRHYLGDVPQQEDFIRRALTSETRKQANRQLSFNFETRVETATSAITGEL
ncbi:putative DNA modification/repair radical SAM protein [Malonomonas rubra DSM 5091]|uniref:Putative DNA modification/repair radical SAM protein n=1 Tax=Malonomonas rubra DSM 5091 TaxID=1122189 RepID=A0A1M6CH64_MALRU|nr:putative DNA modification/repair radical SAM protein [Malonomonas rubra]SHI60263.1 putative DNA modification/repair radical SAM protein [Malonomonas rubra DSM 5091]